MMRQRCLAMATYMFDWIRFLPFVYTPEPALLSLDFGMAAFRKVF